MRAESYVVVASRSVASAITPREQRVLSRLAAGLTREEIAHSEGISLRTVKRLIAALKEKLAAPSAFLLGMKAAQRGLIRADSATLELSAPGAGDGPFGPPFASRRGPARIGAE